MCSRDRAAAKAACACINRREQRYQARGGVVPFVYHSVPRDMVGSILYPLNQLQAIAPDRYAFQKAKYAGREAVLDYRIPGLGLLFNDTVHCSPLPPYYLVRARQELRLDSTARPTAGWWTGMVYAIPLERILIHPVMWYAWKTLWINGSPDDDVPLEPPAEEFVPFDPSHYQELSAPTERHLTYLRTMRDRGRRPLMFVHIPHVLVAGPIDVSGLEPRPWDELPAQHHRAPGGTPTR